MKKLHSKFLVLFLMLSSPVLLYSGAEAKEGEVEKWKRGDQSDSAIRKRYITKVTRKVRNHYKYEESCHDAVVVLVKVDQEGKITSTDLVEKSKKEECNKLAVNAISKTAVLPLPKESGLRKEALEEGFMFSFKRRAIK